MTDSATHVLRPAGGPAAWDAAALGSDRRWELRLAPEAAHELAALARLRAAGGHDLRTLQIGSDDLPRLRAQLAPHAGELLRGRGVLLVRGVPIQGVDPAELRQQIWILGRLFGTGVAQNRRGDLLGDVIDLSDQQASARPFQNGGGLIMHRDPVDVVGLLCVRHARAGGLSRIVSALRIHDLMHAQRPDLLARLYRGFVYHRLDEDRGPGDAEFTPHPVPVFERDMQDGVGCFFIPGPIRRAGRAGHPIDAAGEEALQYFVALSERPGVYYDMDLEPGDLQFLNNRTVLHGRTDYEDFPVFEQRRYMMRLWLMRPDWPALHARQRFFDEADHFGPQPVP